MSRFCIVAPSHILEKMRQQRIMGLHHLLLAHDVCTHAQAYLDLFKPLRGFSPYIIMDNSIVELGSAVDITLIKEALRIVPSTCVVLPDVMESAQDTIDSCSEALPHWSTELGWETRFMLCPQGKTLEAFTQCAEHFADDPRIHYWGCPRNLVKNLGTRLQAIQVLKTLNPQRKVHMLGFSDNFIDDILCAQHPYVHSIDSAVPIRFEGIFQLTSEVGARGDWWHTGELNSWAPDNISRVRKWVSISA